MYDGRSLTSGGVGSPIHIFEGHTAAVLCVQWSPDKASVFGSAAEDGMLNIWDYGKLGNAGTEKSDYPPGLFFRHAGHRDKVVDFHWNAADPWTIVSVSEDGEKTGGGGTLQLLDTSFFHADPHPGNLICTPDEKQLYWILYVCRCKLVYK